MFHYLLTLAVLGLLLAIGIRGRTTLIFSNQQLPNRKPFIKAITNLAGLDAVFRFIQFFLIFVAGQITNNSRFVIDHSRLIMVGRAHKLDKISNVFSHGRRVCRLSRTKGLCSDLRQLTKETTKEKKYLKLFEKLLGLAGDFCNVGFFLADQYTTLFLIGILQNTEHAIIVDLSANIIWTFSNVFYILRDIVTYIRLRSEGKIGKKNMEYLIIDIARNFLDIIVNLCFIVDGFMAKKAVGLLGVVASALWLTDYWRL